MNYWAKALAKNSIGVNLLLFFAISLSACSPSSEKQPAVAKPVGSWMDTVRFNSRLTDEQRQQVYFARNNEEDYTKVRDTTRVMLRFFWWRAFHPSVVVRLENRPEQYDSSGIRKIYQEWFALYKQDIQRLNQDCPIRKGEKCFGIPYPYVHQQHVELLPPNNRPAIVAALDSISFWQMQPEYAAEPHTDGSNWTLEVYYKGKYKTVSTDRQQHPIKSICRRLLKLSAYKVKPEEIY